jgi:hypothetical protein
LRAFQHKLLVHAYDQRLFGRGQLFHLQPTLEHCAEKWIPVFGKSNATTTRALRRKVDTGFRQKQCDHNQCIAQKSGYRFCANGYATTGSWRNRLTPCLPIAGYGRDADDHDRALLKLAGGERSRVDTRATAMLRARMRDSRGVRDVRVGDISPKGLLLACDKPPPRGEIVDIEVGGHHVVGEVRWVSGRRCGLRTQERINVNAIFGGKPPKKRTPGSRVGEAEAEAAIARWPLRRLLLAYGLLGLTAFSTAYLIAVWVIL